MTAWIKLAEGAASTADDIRDQYKGQIAHYSEFVDDFPMTVSGKAQKFLTREAGGPAATGGNADGLA